MTQADDNVELVRKGFAAYDAGDLDTVIAMWHPDVVYQGFSFTGEQEHFQGRDALFGMLMQALTHLEVNTNEFLSLQPVGDEIVVCTMRGTRRPKSSNEETKFDYVMVLRIENGQVTHGADMIDSKAESFWRGVSSSA